MNEELYDLLDETIEEHPEIQDQLYINEKLNILDQDDFMAYYLKHNLRNQYLYDDLYNSCAKNNNDYSTILTDIHNKIMNTEIPYNVWLCLTGICLIMFFLTICGKSTIDQFVFDYAGLNASVKAFFKVIFVGLILLYIFYIRNVKKVVDTLYNFYRYVEHLKLQKIINEKR